HSSSHHPSGEAGDRDRLQPAQGLDCLAANSGRPGIAGGDLVEVEADREVVALPSQHHQVDGGGGDLSDRLHQPAQHSGSEGVATLGPRQGETGAAAPDAQGEALHGPTLAPRRTGSTADIPRPVEGGSRRSVFATELRAMARNSVAKILGCHRTANDISLLAMTISAPAALTHDDLGGTGSPVILLPGAGDTRQGHAALAEALRSAGHRVVDADLPGHGGS